MPIFIKENKKLKDNMYKIPDKLHQYLDYLLSIYNIFVIYLSIFPFTFLVRSLP